MLQVILIYNKVNNLYKTLKYKRNNQLVHKKNNLSKVKRIKFNNRKKHQVKAKNKINFILKNHLILIVLVMYIRDTI